MLSFFVLTYGRALGHLIVRYCDERTVTVERYAAVISGSPNMRTNMLESSSLVE